MINADVSQSTTGVSVSAGAAAIAADQRAADALDRAAATFQPRPIDPRVSPAMAYLSGIADFRTHLHSLARQIGISQELHNCDEGTLE